MASALASWHSAWLQHWHRGIVHGIRTGLVSRWIASVRASCHGKTGCISYEASLPPSRLAASTLAANAVCVRRYHRGRNQSLVAVQNPAKEGYPPHIQISIALTHLKQGVHIRADWCCLAAQAEVAAPTTRRLDILHNISFGKGLTGRDNGQRVK